MFKQNFNGRHYKLPIAIQKTILDNLRRLNIKYVKVLISGIERISYWTLTEVEEIYREGALIKEDRSNSNLTKWGYQYVWDVSDKRLDLKKEGLIQKTIMSAIEV